MRFGAHLGLILSLAVLAVGCWLTARVDAVDSTAAAAAAAALDNQSAPDVKPKLFRILNFSRFKALFNKRYKSWVEELSRMRLFLARCYASFLSIVDYKRGAAKSFKSINEMSDWTSEEWRATLMKPKKELKAAEEDEDDEEDDDEIEKVSSSNKQLEDELKSEAEQEALGIRDESDVERKMIESIRHMDGRLGRDASLEEVRLGAGGAKKRRKRDLMATGQGVDIADLMGGVLSQVDRLEHPQLITTADDGLDDCLMLGDGNMSPPDEQLANRRKHEPVSEEVEYLVDHRACFTEPPRQSKCGACYAFAGLSVLEYQFCKTQRGKQAKFSPQFVIDCSHRGCAGGFFGEVVDFSVTNGVDRDIAYPYFERKKKCYFGRPIEDSRRSGYWHIEGLEKRYVTVDEFETELERSPILINIAVSDGFREYGGGIHELECVPEERLHAMVLVGRGRENGIDFWLLRNSYSVAWGEAGYYRITRESFARCVERDDQSGLIVEGDIKFKLNEHYDAQMMDKLSAQWQERLGTQPASATGKKRTKSRG